jgi:hypothetical protein
LIGLVPKKLNGIVIDEEGPRKKMERITGLTEFVYPSTGR